jgi:hypothetical protein
MWRCYLHVFHITAAIGQLILNPNIRKLQPIVADRQLVFMCPILDLLARPIRTAVAV